MYASGDSKNPDKKPQISLDDLYKLAIKKIRKRVNPHPSTQMKIRELLKILACEDKPLRYSHLVEQMKESPNIPEKNKAGVDGFIKRYSRFLTLDKIIEKIVIVENNTSKEAYQLAYHVKPKPLPPSVREKIRKCEDAWDYVRYEKKDIFYLYSSLLRVKWCLEAMQEYEIITSILSILSKLKIEIERLSLMVEEKHLEDLFKACDLLKELERAYLEISRTKEDCLRVNKLFEKLEEQIHKISSMNLKYPPTQSKYHLEVVDVAH